MFMFQVHKVYKRGKEKILGEEERENMKQET